MFSMHPLEIYDFLNSNYGEEWLEFEPETIRELDIEKNHDEIPEITFNIVMALQAILKRQVDEDDNFFFIDWLIFEKLVLSLNGIVPQFNDVEEAEPHEIQGAIEILKKIKNNVDLDYEVIAYIATSYRTENIVYCPFLSEVDELLEEDELKKEVRTHWEEIKDEESIAQTINNRDGLDNTVKTQLRRLAFIREYSRRLVESYDGRKQQ